MAGVFDHIHLKKKSVGSPNELSFDVLDKASNELEGRAKKPSLPANMPKGVPQSFHGVSGASSLSGQAEVEQRKSARLKSKRRIWMIAFGAVALVVTVVVAVVWALAPRYVQEETHFDNELNDLVAKLVEVDSFVAKVDDLMESPLAEENKKLYKQMLDQIEPYQHKIESIRSDIAKVSAATLSNDRREALKQLDSAAEARSSMLTAAGGTINIASKSETEIQNANAAWASVLDADQKARDASQQANSATTEKETEAAQDLTKQARDQTAEAQRVLQDIVDRHVGIDLAPQMSYLKVKVEALDHALATGEALLSADRAKAQEENAAYNEADEKAAGMAESLPNSVEEAIRSAFDQEIAIYEAKYRASRDQAISADAVVRTYLNEGQSARA